MDHMQSALDTIDNADLICFVLSGKKGKSIMVEDGHHTNKSAERLLPHSSSLKLLAPYAARAGTPR